jgi:hypothetical protein
MVFPFTETCLNKVKAVLTRHVEQQKKTDPARSQRPDPPIQYRVRWLAVIECLQVVLGGRWMHALSSNLAKIEV